MKYQPAIVAKWFDEHGLAATPEYRFDSFRKWRFDFAFLDGKVALEVQGGLFTGGRHTRGAALLKEQEKLNAAAVQGWRILYCVPQELCMQETVDMIRAALRGRK